MYQFSYAEILADDVDDARARERQALDQAVALLLHAEESEPFSAAQTKALEFTVALWASFIRDLAHPGNSLGDQLRADLMSIGLGVMAEVGRIDRRESRDLKAIADVCAIVRDGLR